MKTENMNILEHTLQGSLKLDNFYFYKTARLIFLRLKSVGPLCILHIPQSHSHAQFIFSQEDQNVGFVHLFVEVQLTFV